MSLTRAGSSAELTPLVITPYGGMAAATWPSANQGIFVKFQVGRSRLITGVRFFVGALSGNAKVGLYASDGTDLTQMSVSASTAVAGSSAPQDINLAAGQRVDPLIEYCAYLVLDNATATIGRFTTGAGGFAVPAGLDTHYAVNSGFTTPPTTQAIASTTVAASGYLPVLVLY